MIFDLKTAERVARRYLWPTVVAFLLFCPVFAGSFRYVWHWERDLNERERDLNVKDIDQQKRKLIIEQQEAILKQREANLAEQAATILKNNTDGRRSLARLQTLQAELSEKSQLTKVDDQLQQLVREFAATGVDLHQRPACSDTEAVKQYEHAVAIRQAVSGLASSNQKLFEKYEGFLQQTELMFGYGCKP